MPIIDLQKRLVEVGRIRMGNKSDKGAPQKLETFRITSSDQARLGEIAGVYGGTVTPWADRPGEFEVTTTTSELPILLLPGQALSQWYELWSAGGCQRRCDGVTDVISDGPCVCDQSDGDRVCKPTTRLSVMLPEIPGLGVWRLESHGYYAAVELSATAGMLEQATARGQMFPARLRIDQRRQVKQGKTTRYAVPVIDIDVRLPEALSGVGQAAISAGYTPIAAKAIQAGISVEEALDAVALEAAPRIPNGRSPAPLGPPADDIAFGEAAPIPVEDTPAPMASAVPKPTAQQSKKLDVLVGQLRDAGHLTTAQLYAAVAKDRNLDADMMIDLIGGRDVDGQCHWAPLRDSLSKAEASALIDRLSKFEESVVA